MKPNPRLLTQIVLCLGFFAHSVFGQTTEFTYQGRLADDSVAASGTYQMQFSLFGSVAGSDQIGTTLTFDGVGGNPAPIAVTNGVFTVSLNFGTSSFDGTARFVEISIFSTTTSTYVVLIPRQPVTSAPHAVRALNAATADSLSALCVGCVTAAQIGNVNGGTVTGTIPVASVPAGSPDYIQNTVAQQPASNFNISGNGAVSGTLSGNIVRATTQYNIGGSRVLSNGGTANIFVGGSAGSNNATGFSNSFVGANAGASNTAGSDNAFFGRSAGLNNSTGDNNSFFGRSAGSTNRGGYNNSFVGRSAGAFNSVGFDNSFFGMNAGVRTTTGDRNAFFGRGAGLGNQTGADNTVIGAFADVNSGNLSFATAIGAGAVVGGINQIQLGRSGEDIVRIGKLATGSSSHLCSINFYISSCSSSARYKENIRPFVSGLSLVRQLQPVTFDWIGREEHDLGLIAEKVEKVEPLLVTYNQEGQVEGVKYDQIAVIAINAIKEQQKLIEEQRDRIEEQQEQIDELKEIVCSIKPDAAPCKAGEN